MQQHRVTVRLNALPSKQSGIALLMLIIVLIFAITSYYFSTISIENARVEQQQQTRSALNKAKQALLDYAVMHASVNGAGNGIGSGDPGEYGYLPCPYIDNATDGAQNLQCGNRHINSIGLLPWVSMETVPFRDGSGNCLWYVVSGSYKNNTFSGLLNQDSLGMIQLTDDTNNIITGNAIEDRPVALIIAPGAAVAGQNRANNNALACGTDGQQPGQYLDFIDPDGDGLDAGDTNNAVLNGAIHVPDAFVHADLNSDGAEVDRPYNDQFVTITREEIWSAVQDTNIDFDTVFTETTEALALCLAEYAGHPDNVGRKLPWPAPLAVNDYRDLTDYDDVPAAAPVYAGRFPFVTDDSNAEIGAAFDASVDDDFIDTGIIIPADKGTGICDNLGGAADYDLSDDRQIHRKVYENWKDHFFYALSPSYEPDTSFFSPCINAGDCLTVAGEPKNIAAIVFFAGMPDDQLRIYDDLAGVDEKANVDNYLENGNNDDFNNGTRDFSPSATDDIMFCLIDFIVPTVIAC